MTDAVISASGCWLGRLRLRRTLQLGLLLSWVVVANVWTPPVLAQPAVDGQRFRPPPGPRLAAGQIDARPLQHGEVAVSGGIGYAHDVATRGELGVGGGLTDLAALDVGLALGLYGALDVGLVVPLTAARLQRSAGATDVVMGVGDLRALAKLALWRADGWIVAGALEVNLPTAHPKYPFGDRAWAVTPGAVVRGSAGSLVWGGRVAYRLRERPKGGEIPVDDAVLLSAALEGWFSQPLAAFTEIQVDVPAMQRHRARGGAEGLVGLIARLGQRTLVRVGAGVGMGLGAPLGHGTPELRTFAAVTSSFGAFACQGVEDLDGYRDGDGCPDWDNDGDGLLDAQDQCRNDPEDVDGFQDQDGCPDLDDDADGLLDGVDRCPRLSEDWDGFEDDDGCPEPDNDRDGVADGYDVCGMEPEDLDGFGDEDGCPEPGPKPATVTIAKGRILVSERIYFEDGRDVIRSVSLPVLEQIASAIAGLGADKRVRIVGYTDDRGAAEHNRDLSLRRAQAVGKELVGRGVPEDRLRFEGRGGEEPVASNDTPEGRAMNRRVELHLVPVEDKGGKAP